MESVVDVAVGLLIRKRDGARHVLITRRCEQAVLGRYWEFPGGKIEPGETPQQCVAREFMEEVGLGVCVQEALPPVEYRYEHALVRLQPFYCAFVSGQLQDLQVAEHKWVLPCQLNSYQFPPANQSLLQQLVAHLGGGDRQTVVQEA